MAVVPRIEMGTDACESDRQPHHPESRSTVEPTPASAPQMGPLTGLRLLAIAVRRPGLLTLAAFFLIYMLLPAALGVQTAIAP